MVAAKPELGDVLEVFIMSDLRRFDVTVVIYYRKNFGIFVIEREGSVVFQKEVVVDQFHVAPLFVA